MKTKVITVRDNSAVGLLRKLQGISRTNPTASIHDIIMKDEDFHMGVNYDTITPYKAYGAILTYKSLQ